MWDALVGLVSGGGSALSMAGGVIESLFNYRMWRSLGWLLLGIVITIMGFLVWNRKAIGGAAKTAVSAVPAVV